MSNSEKRSAVIFPKELELLRVMGEQILLASKRRNLTQIQISERTGINRQTIRKIFKGDPTVSLGHFFNVLRVLNLEKDFLKLAKDDELGRKLQDIELLNSNSSQTKNLKKNSKKSQKE